MSINFGPVTVPKPEDWFVVTGPQWALNEGDSRGLRAVVTGSMWRNHPIVLMVPTWWDEGMTSVQVARFNQTVMRRT